MENIIFKYRVRVHIREAILNILLKYFKALCWFKDFDIFLDFMKDLKVGI